MEQPRNTTFGWVFGVVLILSLAVAGAGIYLAARGQGWTMLAAGSACVVGTLAAWGVAATLCATRASASAQLREGLQPFADRMEQVSVMLNLISEQQLLSDRGKSIAYRTRDREALKFAIQEEISRSDRE